MNQPRPAEITKAPPARGVVKQLGLWLRLMDISQGRFALRILNEDGSVSLVAEGRIALEGDDPPTALKLSPTAMS